ncbi:MAG: pyruvate, phosphate dikinase [Anaerolineae bacterium]|nr:pyruvate, phosphate dikinase [Anaerolineae bacterium]
MFTRWFTEIGAADLATAGGKGASLGALLQAGLPVPPGFVVLTSAYHEFVAANGLQGAIARRIAHLTPDATEALEEAARQIGRLFAQASISDAVAAEMAAMYRQLGGGPVAVRSSATAEDLPGLSFAGQYTTTLNVTGAVALCQAVRSCWASLWNARAISYRMQHDVTPDGLALAVIVQQLVAGDKAGILFTANPLNGRRDQLLINASWGLGEAIVGGEVSPDQWVVDKASGRTVESRIARKSVMTVLRETGTQTMAVPEDLQQTPVLNDDELAQVVVLARQVESHAGAPQDVEWVWRAGQCYLVQSRPITSLFPLPEPLPDPSAGLRIHLCLNMVFQSITEPLTPMGLEFFRLLYAGLAAAATGRRTPYPAWARRAAGRMYLDVTSLLRDARRWPALVGAISRKDPIAGQALHRFLEANAAAIGGGRPARLPWRLVLHILPGLICRVGYGVLSPTGARSRLITLGDRAIARLERHAAGLTDMASRLRFVEEEAGRSFWTAIHQVAYCGAGLRGTEIAVALVERWLGDGTVLHPALQALPDNPTTEMGLALLEAAQALQEKTAPGPDDPAVQDILQRFGHRAVQEIDMGVPRWREDPTYLLEVLAAYMAQGHPGDKVREFRDAAARAEASVADVVARVRRGKGPAHAWLLGRLLRRVRVLAGLRERPKFDLVRALAVLRCVLHDVGRELAAQGRLQRAADVFFVTFADIEAEDDLRAIAAANRAQHERELARTAVPRIIASTGACLYGAQEAAGESVLAGVPVSPGVYEGQARIVHRPQGSQLQPGEILVTHSTDPGWTPLFLHAGAVVMESGGPISHGAIVAREYGIPAVASVEAATTRLRTGQRLRVNGESGEVVCLD